MSGPGYVWLKDRNGNYIWARPETKYFTSSAPPMYNTPIEAGRDGQRGSGLPSGKESMKLRIKKIAVTGPPKNTPALWYRDEESRNNVYNAMVVSEKTWAWRALDDYRTGKEKYIWDDGDFDDDDTGNPQQIWYGVALDLDLEVNEFGTILP